MTVWVGMPSGTPDPYIAEVALNARAAAKIVLRWKVLEVKVLVGQARPVDALDDEGSGEMLPCSRSCAPYPHVHWVKEETWSR